MCGVRLSEVSRRDFGLPHVDAMVGLLAGAASVAWGPLQQGGEHRCWTHALDLRVPAEKDPGRCLLQGRGMCWCCMGRGQVGKGAGAAGTETGSEKSILDDTWTRSQGCRTRGGLTGPSPPLLGCGRRVGMSRLRHAGSSHGRCAPGEESKGTEQTGWTPDVLGWDVAYPKPVYFCKRTVPRHCVLRSTGCEIGRSLFTIYYLCMHAASAPREPARA